MLRKVYRFISIGGVVVCEMVLVSGGVVVCEMVLVSGGACGGCVGNGKPKYLGINSFAHHGYLDK